MSEQIEKCKHGHEWTVENTRWIQSRPGQRICKQCERRAGKKRRRKPEYREQQRERVRKFYQNHPEKMREQSRNSAKRRREILEKIRTGRFCIKCGENYPACLDFHHRDPSQKSFEIAAGVSRYSIERVFEEIEKTDVLCANCHRKYHWEESYGEVA